MIASERGRLRCSGTRAIFRCEARWSKQCMGCSMIVIQTPWTVRDADSVLALLVEARRTTLDIGAALALLPHADGSESDAPAEADVTAVLGLVHLRRQLLQLVLAKGRHAGIDFLRVDPAFHKLGFEIFAV